MIWSFPAGRFGGTTVRIHVTFLLLLAWIGLDSYFTSGLDVASRTVVFVVLVFACVVAHEFGHVLTARVFGIETPDITLYPFGGVARLHTMPQQPSQEFAIAIAGPLVNIVIAAALLLFAGASLDFAGIVVLPSEQIDLATRVATTNIVLAGFNLIPAFPMDGGRLLRAGLAAGVGFDRATRLAARVGHWIALGFAVAGLFTNPMLIVIAVFIFFAATAEMQAMSVKSFSKDLPVTRAMITEFASLRGDATLGEAVDCFLRTSQTVVPVTGDDGRFQGVLEIGNVVRALHESESRALSVSDIMTVDVPMLPQTTKLAEAFRALQEAASPTVAIVDDGQRLVGLVTPETVGEMLMLHEASEGVFDHLQPRAASSLAPRPVH